MLRLSRTGVRFLTSAATAASIALALGPVGEGPLRLGGGGVGDLCAPVRQGDSILLGEVIEVPQGPVTVESLDLLRPEGLAVIDAVVFPVVDGGLGTSLDPPTDYPPWENRVPVAGAELRAGLTYNLVVKASRSSEAAGSAKAMSLTYRMGGVQYTTSGTTRYTLRDACF